MGECIDTGELEALVSGDLPPERLSEINRHAEACPRCRKEIARRRANEHELHRLRQLETTTLTQATPATRGRHSLSSAAGPTPKTAAATVLPEQVEVEGYRIGSVIKEGGQGVVYKAVQLAGKRPVALKVLREGPFANERARRRFEREVELVAGLQHPNIVTLYESGIIRGEFYFAMEYIPGRTLIDHVRWRTPSTREAMTLFRKVCAGVAHAHQHGVIHRDLKPSNVLVDDDGEPHIVDFGLAKVAGARDHGATMTGAIMGTLAYMSPEQAAGRSDSVDVRSDVYALGLLLYEMLTGSLPYDVRGDTLTVLRTIQETEPIRPSKRVKHFDREIEAILLVALAKRPEERYQSAAELGGDVQRWLNGDPLVVQSSSSIYLIRKLIARHRYTSTVVGLVALILVSALSISVEFYRRERAALGRWNRDRQQLSTLLEAYEKRSEEHILRFRRQRAFGWFLSAWRQGRTGSAMDISTTWFSPGTREALAAEFLLDKRPLADKRRAFAQSQAADQRHFVEFVLGEHHLARGHVPEAIQAFRNAARTMGIDKGRPNDAGNADRMLAIWVTMRLDELASPTTTAPAVKGN